MSGKTCDNSFTYTCITQSAAMSITTCNQPVKILVWASQILEWARVKCYYGVANRLRRASLPAANATTTCKERWSRSYVSMGGRSTQMFKREIQSIQVLLFLRSEERKRKGRNRTTTLTYLPHIHNKQ